MAAFEDETTRRRREFYRERRLRAGMPANWREQLGLEPERQDAPQNAQDAPGRPEAVNAAPMPPRDDWFARVNQRADDARDRHFAQGDRMAAAVEQTFRDENDSRVAQAREARRMQFARDMEQMRHENLLQRLAAEQSPRRSSPLIFDSLVKRNSGPWMVRSWNPATGTWEYTDPDEDGNIAFGG